MAKIEIRYPQVKDAPVLFNIVSNPNFIYFNPSAKSVADEIDWIKTRPEKRKQNQEYNYAILYNGQVVGGVGLKINQSREYIGEIGYVVDEKYWGKGIASRAVKLIEKERFKNRGLSRLEILMQPENKASERVAIKAGYLKEGLLRKYIKGKDGRMKDSWLYAKVL